MPLIQNGSNGLLKELRIILLDYNHHILYHRENMFGMVKSSVKRSKCANYATLRNATLFWLNVNLVMKIVELI
jgi:hypothetical protein